MCEQRRLFPICGVVVVASFAFALFGHACAAQTLTEIKNRGTLVCGVSEGVFGFSIQTTKGGWTGFDVDFCRAIAAAVFGDVAKVEYIPLDVASRFEALRSGRVDILSRNTTWTMSRETDLDLIFPAITYFDGQGFLIRKTYPATSTLEFEDAKICVQSYTTTAPNLDDYFKAKGIHIEPIVFPRRTDALRAYDAHRCDALTSDQSALHGDRLELATPEDHVILRDTISKEPFGPWPAPGFEDTELGVFMGPEVSRGETKVYAGVQA